jgi:uncharacterized protein YbjT (DUF2867 family)
MQGLAGCCSPLTSACNPIAEEHRAVEADYACDDVEVGPIHPPVLAPNSLGWAGEIRATGSVSLYRPDALTAPIHDGDVAEVIVAALTGTARPQLSGILTGPARLTRREQVAALADALDLDIGVRQLDRDEAHGRMARFLPAHEAEGILTYLDDAHAGNSGRTDLAVSILGRSPRGFAQWAIDNAAAFRSDRARYRAVTRPVRDRGDEHQRGHGRAERQQLDAERAGDLVGDESERAVDLVGDESDQAREQG